MKKLCYFSLIIGIGIGMIITASLNELARGGDVELPQISDDDLQGELEKTLGEIKSDLTIPSEQPKEPVKKDDKPSEIIEDDELNETEGDKIEDTELLPLDLVEITILPGMHTQGIADLMVEKGLVERPEDFINKAYEKDVTKKFRAGKVQIPKGSTIEEIFELLTKRP